MTDRILQDERKVWMISVAVLATSLAWLAAVDLVLLISAHGLPTAFVVARPLVRSALLVARHAAALAPAAPALPFAPGKLMSPNAIALGAALALGIRRSDAEKEAPRD